MWYNIPLMSNTIDPWEADFGRLESGIRNLEFRLASLERLAKETVIDAIIANSLVEPCFDDETNLGEAA